MAVITRPRFMGAHRRIQAYRDVGAILGSGGTDYAIIPIGDTDHENAARTTVTTVGSGAGDGLVFTYSEARTSFDLATKNRHNQLFLPDVPFNGTDEEADSPDADFWSRVSAPFSVGGWVNLTDATSSVLLSKIDTAGNTREWNVGFSAGDDFAMTLIDENVSGNPVISTTADVVTAQDVWVFVVATADGTANATGLNLYEAGVIVASTDTDQGTFVAMENLGGTVKLGHLNATPSNLFDGRMLGGPIGVFYTQQELNASQIARLFRIGKAAQG